MSDYTDRIGATKRCTEGERLSVSDASPSVAPRRGLARSPALGGDTNRLGYCRSGTRPSTQLPPDVRSQLADDRTPEVSCPDALAVLLLRK
jgi:hypothetical protein